MEKESCDESNMRRIASYALKMIGGDAEYATGHPAFRLKPDGLPKKREAFTQIVDATMACYPDVEPI